MKMLKNASVAALVTLLAVATTSGQIKRTVLQQVDMSIAGREVVTAKAEIPAGGGTGLHTHPGDEVTYVLDGAIDLVIDGATKTYTAGQAFMVPAGKVHDAKASGGAAVAIANYIIEKGKPVTTPVK